MSMKILLALDGSANSLKAAEHVGRVSCSCRDMEITFYHVIVRPPELSEHPGEHTAGDEERLKEALKEKQKAWLARARERVETTVFAPARTVFRTSSVSETQALIRTKVEAEAHLDAALAIINEAKTGGYDVVVMGRRGVSMLKEFVFGGVTCKVIHHLRGCAIWIAE